MTSITYVEPQDKYDSGRRYQPTAESRARRDKALFVASLIPSVRVGRAALGVLQASRLGGAVRAVSFLKRPVHTIAALPRVTGTVLRHPHPFVVKSLAYRKRLGTAALGVSLLNPMQNVHYFSKKDWKRLGINLRWPIVGIPIYEFISRGSGAPSSSATKRTKQPYRRKSSQSGGKGRTGYTGSRPSGRPSSGEAAMRAKRARKKCPAGYYWSWKKKACVKSRYRR
jgi:hypothetical protein